jgi:PAS domain-containing protein
MVEDYLSGERSANDGEWRVRATDGSYRWIRIRSICLRNAAGQAVRMAGSVSDIDAWKKAQAALRLSEERYALAMGVAEEGHLDWNVQTDEFFASAQAKRVLNVPPDAECRTRDDMMARVPYHPDDAPGFSAAWDTSLAGREAEHELEFRILRGEEVRWIRRRWKIFRDAGDAPQRVIGVVSDITERRQAVETLRASESRFRALTELSSDAYWAQDENLRFVPTGSQHDLAGYPSDSHVGKTRWELSDATPLSGSWTEHEAVLNARETFRDFEYRRVNPKAPFANAT